MEKKNPKTSFISIGAVLKEILDRQPVVKTINNELKIWELWDQVVGAEISKQTKPLNLRNGILFVETKNSMWVTELQFRRHTICKKLNEELGSPMVRDIQFRLARVPRTSN